MTFGNSRSGSTDIFLEKATSFKLRQQLQNGELPPSFLDRIDKDRIEEAEEDFLVTDRSQPIAIPADQLKPQVVDLRKEDHPLKLNIMKSGTVTCNFKMMDT